MLHVFPTVVSRTWRTYLCLSVSRVMYGMRVHVSIVVGVEEDETFVAEDLRT